MQHLPLKRGWLNTIAVLRLLLYLLALAITIFLVELLTETFGQTIVKNKGSDMLLAPYALAIGLIISWYYSHKVSYKLLSITTYKDFGKWAMVAVFIAYGAFKTTMVWVRYDLEKSRQLLAAIIATACLFIIIRGFLVTAFMNEDKYESIFKSTNKK